MDDPVDLLAQIHSQEQLIAQRLANAQTQANSSLVAARQQAKVAIAEAQQEGEQAGTAVFQTTLAQIDEEATAIRQQAQDRANQLEMNAEMQMETAVNFAIRLIVGHIP